MNCRTFVIIVLTLAFVLAMTVSVFADTPSAIKGDDDLILVGLKTENRSVTANDATGLKAVLLSIIGDYDTVITDYTYQSGSSGYYSHSISIERDYAWIWSCILLIVVMYCVFRAIGGIICK